MTTIGFGDYVPSNTFRSEYAPKEQFSPYSFLWMVNMVVPLLLGLSIVAAIVDSFAKCYEDLKSARFIRRVWKAHLPNRSSVTARVEPMEHIEPATGTSRILPSPEFHMRRRYSV